MSDFVRVTDPKGNVHWVNLFYVRKLSVHPERKSAPTQTAIHIDNVFVERILMVVETPEDILAQRT